MMRPKLLFAGAALTLILSACSGATATTPETLAGEQGQVVRVESGGQYVDIVPQQLRAMLEKKDFFFVNVHVPYEGEIPATDAFVPYDEVAARLGEFPQRPDARIVVYCRSGGMSAVAAQTLVQAGYTNVYNLAGGFRAWDSAGYALIQNP